MARRKTEFSKDPKDVKYEQKSNKCYKQDRTVKKKKKHIPKLLKSLFYRIGTSNVHRCISNLTHTDSTNHSAPLHSKTKLNIRTDSGGFYILLCIYRTHSQIPEEKRKMCVIRSFT